MARAKETTILAGALIIGDEILSGRTREANLAYIAQFLGDMGIEIAEARVVSDKREEIVAAVNAMRKKYAYLFTTGGIGPTHDDITAASVAAAFGRPMERNAEAEKAIILHHRRQGREINEARLRMADMPQSVKIVENSISGAPGFCIENVFVLAGVPLVCRAMMDKVAPMLEGGAKLHGIVLLAQNLGEGDIAPELKDIQERFGDVRIGSYPYFRDNGYGVRIVLRAHEKKRLQSSAEAVRLLILEKGRAPATEESR